VAGSCKQGNEPSCFIKVGNFLTSDRLLASQEILRHMELVAYTFEP